MLKSGKLRNSYKLWQKEATPEQIEFVDSVYEMCEKYYDDGGDTIVECYGTLSSIVRTAPN